MESVEGWESGQEITLTIVYMKPKSLRKEGTQVIGREENVNHTRAVISPR